MGHNFDFYGDIHGISEEKVKELIENLSNYFEEIRYECGTLIVSRYGRYDDIQNGFDLIAKNITTEDVSYLSAECCDTDEIYRVYFKKGKWKEVDPEITWPQDPFDETESSRKHPVLNITKSDVSEGLFEYRSNVIMKDDDEATENALHEKVMNLSRKDMEAIAKNLGNELLNHNDSATIFWESLGQLANTVIEANNKEATKGTP